MVLQRSPHYKIKFLSRSQPLRDYLLVKFSKRRSSIHGKKTQFFKVMCLYNGGIISANKTSCHCKVIPQKMDVVQILRIQLWLSFSDTVSSKPCDIIMMMSSLTKNPLKRTSFLWIIFCPAMVNTAII